MMKLFILALLYSAASGDDDYVYDLTKDYDDYFEGTDPEQPLKPLQLLQAFKQALYYDDDDEG